MCLFLYWLNGKQFLSHLLVFAADSLHDLAAKILTPTKNIVNNFMTGDIGATRAFSHAFSILYTRLAADTILYILPIGFTRCNDFIGQSSLF